MAFPSLHYADFIFQIPSFNLMVLEVDLHIASRRVELHFPYHLTNLL